MSQTPEAIQGMQERQPVNLVVLETAEEQGDVFFAISQALSSLTRAEFQNSLTPEGVQQADRLRGVVKRLVKAGNIQVSEGDILYMGLTGMLPNDRLLELADPTKMDDPNFNLRAQFILRKTTSLSSSDQPKNNV